MNQYFPISSRLPTLKQVMKVVIQSMEQKGDLYQPHVWLGRVEGNGSCRRDWWAGGVGVLHGYCSDSRKASLVYFRFAGKGTSELADGYKTVLNGKTHLDNTVGTLQGD